VRSLLSTPRHTYRKGFERPSHRGKTLLTPPARATIRENEPSPHPLRPGDLLVYHPKRVDRQTGIITG
jgi:hypothetical protein